MYALILVPSSFSLSTTQRGRLICCLTRFRCSGFNFFFLARVPGFRPAPGREPPLPINSVNGFCDFLQENMLVSDEIFHFAIFNAAVILI